MCFYNYDHPHISLIFLRIFIFLGVFLMVYMQMIVMGFPQSPLISIMGFMEGKPSGSHGRQALDMQLTTLPTSLTLRNSYH